jgi:predicted MFS family arabinose efflux permease
MPVKYKKAAYIVGAFLIIALIFVYAGRGKLAENPFEKTRVFEDLSHAITGSDASLIVTDGGKTRVSVLTGGTVSATIRGGRETGGFFYAEHIAAGGGKVYIADVKYEQGSTRVEAERILQFTSGGRFEKTLFEHTYEQNKPFQYGNILDMRFFGGTLIFIFERGNTLELYGIADSEPVLLREIPAINAPYLCSAFFDASSDKVYAVSKDGIIYAEKGAYGLTVLADKNESGIIPWEIAADTSGGLFITDLASRSIIKADGSVFFYAQGVVYRLDINENGIVSFTDIENVYQLNTSGRVIFEGSEVAYGAGYFTLRSAVWLLAVITALILVYTAIRFVIWFIKRNKGNQIRYMLVIILSMVLTALIIAAAMINSSFEHNEKKIEYNITQVILTVSGFTGYSIGDDLESINSLTDYGGPAFTRIRETLDPICEAAYQQGEYMYYVLYRVIDGQMIAVMDYENTIGVIYPLGECPEEYYVILSGEQTVLYEKGSDAYGSWTYAVAPVYNSLGEIIGLLEMGSNLDVETLRINRQIREIVLSTAVLLILFLLIFTEATALADIKNPELKTRTGHIPELIRPLTFLAFLADSTYAVFIPQLSGQIFESSGFNFTSSLGAALPLSVHLFFIAVASILGGKFIDRLGMRSVLVTGLATEIAGLGLTAFAVASGSYILLLAGMSVSGCGLGVVVVSGNTLPATYENTQRRNSLFSGVNVGLVSGIVVGTSLGSYVAGAAGYAMTFVLSAFILLPALWLGFKCAPRSHGLALSIQEDDLRKPQLTMPRFLSSVNVFSFLLFAMFPFMTILYFKDFVFPLFASRQGYSEVGIGQTLLFSGAISILIGPSVSSALLKRLGAKGTNVAMGALFAGGLLLFSFAPTLGVAIIVVYILTIAGCVGLVAQGVYFSSLRACKAYGAGRSMGVYSLFDNLSQTAGPLLFGAALILGYSMAGLLIGIAAAVLLVLFAALGENDKGETV